MEFKRSFISTLCFSLVSLSAIAQPYDSTFQVTIPNLEAGFEFNIAALWMRPGASNLNYVIYNEEIPAQSPAWNERELRPAYTWGVEVGAGYILPCSGADVYLDWIHLNSTTSGTTDAPNSDFFLGPDYEIGPPGLEIRHANGHVRFKYDVINLTLGQFVDFGSRVRMRFFTGLSAGFLREDVVSNYSGDHVGATIGPFNMKQDITANFNGLGPRFGTHTEVDLGFGIGFEGEAAMSALIGSTYSKTNFTGQSPELLNIFNQNINYQLIKDQNVLQVIPGFDTKLGFNYKYHFCNGMSLSAAVGYQAAVYVNAISQYLPESLVPGFPLQSGGIFVATMEHRLSNYSVAGPYLNFGFKM